MLIITAVHPLVHTSMGIGHLTNLYVLAQVVVRKAVDKQLHGSCASQAGLQGVNRCGESYVNKAKGWM